MARILHVSDLHLHSRPADDIIGDAKSAVIRPAQQQTHLNRLISTFTALANEVPEGGLEAIVVSGDIADKYDVDAFDLLDQALAPLVPSRVGRDRVIVVPGNHDVLRESSSSTTERYKAIADLRSRGYILPLLEGVDIDDSGKTLDSTVAQAAHWVVARDESFFIIAVNSSNLSQLSLPTEPYLEAHLDKLRSHRRPSSAMKALLRAWEDRGRADVAWIGTGQQTAVANSARILRETYPRAISIAAMHHQLLPVGTTAEVKPFEMMPNLGEVMEWLADIQMDVVLHGHKHVGRVSTYEHRSFARGGFSRPFKSLIVSAPSAQTQTDPQASIARLIDVSGPAPRAGGIVTTDLSSVGPGGVLDLARIPIQRHVIDSGIEWGMVSGDTALAVHDKLRAIAPRLSDVQRPLVCRIETGQSGSIVPTGFPAPEVGADHQTWFDEMVEWWQRPTAGSSAVFNHGERLRNLGARRANSGLPEFDQVELAIDALFSKAESSRAIAILVEPRVDLASSASTFPAFTLVQFVLEGDQVNLHAYFRKQEMTHWWAINVGELARLQNEVVTSLNGRGRQVECGSITTVTAIPTAGKGVPRVAVPKIDRMAEELHGLVPLVAPLYAVTQGAGTLELWKSVFADWLPSPEPGADGDPVPARGLVALESLIKVFSAQGEKSAEIERLIAAIELLAECCRSYEQSSDSKRPTQRNRWSEIVHAQVPVVLDLINQRLTAIGSLPS